MAISLCECDWSYHDRFRCPNTVAHHSHGVVTSPALCVPCLHICTQEREQAANSWAVKR